jgi:hypothetical protein
LKDLFFGDFGSAFDFNVFSFCGAGPGARNAKVSLSDFKSNHA